MKLNLVLENASSSVIPDEEDVHRWVTTALSLSSKETIHAAELSVRIVDEKESAELNDRYRQKPTPTNVLSFPADLPKDIQSQLEYPPLGDLVICSKVVEREAQQQNKPPTSHWAHMFVHGSLHLIGYDHIEEQQAQEMENLEINILSNLGFTNPYILYNQSPQGADTAT